MTMSPAMNRHKNKRAEILGGGDYEEGYADGKVGAAMGTNNSSDYARGFLDGQSARLSKQYDINGLAPVAPPQTVAKTAPARNDGLTLLLSVVGGAAGYFMWRKHPVLGALSGIGGGVVASQIVSGAYTKAILGLGITGASVAGSLAWEKHPALGFVGASLGASMLGHVVVSSTK